MNPDQMTVAVASLKTGFPPKKAGVRRRTFTSQRLFELQVTLPDGDTVVADVKDRLDGLRNGLPWEDIAQAVPQTLQAKAVVSGTGKVWILADSLKLWIAEGRKMNVARKEGTTKVEPSPA